jgi:two-component system CheB/CheR fusion protein
MREESEAANEELRAANEELQSINEEYRSTAEELETSKEELQSINEELQTVNSELKLKLETVSRANSDLQNLMASMDFGTLFLDPNLRIKLFTPRLTDLFSITPGDVGRPITDFTHRLDYDGLVRDARAVLEDLAPIERELRSREGGWYLVRMRPYRTMDDKIDGVVATFIDVTERRQMKDDLRVANEKLEQQNGKPRKD